MKKLVKATKKKSNQCVLNILAPPTAGLFVPGYLLRNFVTKKNEEKVFVFLVWQFSPEEDRVLGRLGRLALQVRIGQLTDKVGAVLTRCVRCRFVEKAVPRK